MSFLDHLNFAEKAREKKKRAEYLAALTPEQRGVLFDSAVSERRAELSAERAAIGAGMGTAVDFSKTGVMSSFAAVALTPTVGMEGAALAAGGIAATSLSSAAILSAQGAWVEHKSKKLEQAASSLNRHEFTGVGYLAFNGGPGRDVMRSIGPLDIDKMSVPDMERTLKKQRVLDALAPAPSPFSAAEQAREKQKIAREQAQAAPEMFEGVISSARPPEKQLAAAVVDVTADPVQAAREKQRIARADVQNKLGAPTVEAPVKEAQAPVITPATEAPAAESKPYCLGRDRSMKEFVAASLASGSKLLDNNGKPVIETKDALIAPASLRMSDDKRRERVEAMVEHATQKFPGQPLRLDGNEKFVGMALEAALARGLAVEVPEKHKKLLEQIETKLAQSKPAPGVPDVEGTITAGTRVVEVNKAPAKDAEVKQPGRITGKLMSVAEQPDERGLRMAVVQRAGMDHAVWVPAEASNDLKPLVGKGVVFEPPAKDAPARLVGLDQKKQQARDNGQELQR